MLFPMAGQAGPDGRSRVLSDARLVSVVHFLWLILLSYHPLYMPVFAVPLGWGSSLQIQLTWCLQITTSRGSMACMVCPTRGCAIWCSRAATTFNAQQQTSTWESECSLPPNLCLYRMFLYFSQAIKSIIFFIITFNMRHSLLFLSAEGSFYYFHFTEALLLRMRLQKMAFFICNSGAFASTEVFQEIHIPQPVLVSSQALSQQEMLSWKSPALYPQPFLGLLRLSFPAHSLFPAPMSSSPLQLLFLFSLTPKDLSPLYHISSCCPYSFHTSSSCDSDAKPTLQGPLLLCRWLAFSKESSPCSFWLLCCDAALNCSKP